MSWLPIVTARRSSSTKWRASSTASRTTRSPLGTTIRAPSCWRSSASPTPIPWKWWTWCAQNCRRCARRCRRRSRWRRCSTVRSRSAPRSANVQETLAIAICLVIMVIFLFLRKVSATIIPALAVPVSLIGTCAAMYAFGFSINNMTLLALTLSVGFVVDDAIVMLENIVRHIEGGMRPFEAALKGSREIGFTIVSITFSLIAVFIPVLLMGGMVGRVFREFAVSISVAIIVSGFVSLTLTPMLCARVLKSHDPHEKQNFVLRGFERLFEGMLRTYQWSLDRVLSFKSIMLMVTLATIVGTIWLYIIVPKGFFPTEDTGYVLAHHRGQDRHRLPGHGRASAQGRRYHSGGQGRRLYQLDCGLRRTQLACQQRPHAGGAERPQRARAFARHACAAAARIQRRSRHAGLLPADPEHPAGRTAEQEPVSIHAAIQRHGNALPYGAGAARQDREGGGPARRHHRSLYQESAGHRRGRPREGGGLRRLDRSGAPGALQRLRLAPGRHHLHLGQ